MVVLQAMEVNVPRILITEPIAQEGIDLLRYELPEAQIDVRLDLSPEHLLALIGNYTVLIIRSQTRVTEEVLAKATHLQVIGRAGSGLDNIDLDAAIRHGVLVVHAPRGNAIAVAEQTMCAAACAGTTHSRCQQQHQSRQVGQEPIAGCGIPREGARHHRPGKDRQGGGADGRRHSACGSSPVIPLSLPNRGSKSG